MSLFNRFLKIISSNLKVADKGSPAADTGHHNFQEEDDSCAEPSIGPEEMKYRANLEVGVNADMDEIRCAYKRLIKSYHPDLHAQSKSKAAIAEQITKQLNEAMNYFENKYGGS